MADQSLRKLLDRIGEADDAQLLDVEQTILANLAEAQKDETVPLEDIRAMADAVRTIREEAARRLEAAERRQAEVADILADVMPTAEAEDDDAGEADDGEDGEDDEADDGEEAVTTDESAEAVEEPAPIAAAADPKPVRDVKLRPIKIPEDRKPRIEVNEDHAVIVASAGLPGHPDGGSLNLRELCEAMSYSIDSMRGSRAAGRRRVATIRWSYPEDRQLGGDPGVNFAKIEAATNPQAILAAGGICAPVAPQYNIFGYGVDDRPVRDTLVRFAATRGGISVTAPPLLTTIDDGVTEHSNADDEAETAKNCLTVTCPTPTETQVNAIVFCLQFGNFRARFWPEQVQRWLQLGTVAHARQAEQSLLDSIAAGSTAVTDGQNLGAARDLLNTHGRLASQMRSRHRMAPNEVIDVLMPAWARDMIREDLARQQPGDNALAIADAQIDTFWMTRHLRPVYYLDSSAAGGMVQGPQGAGAALPWEATVISYLFPEGSWLFLDGGELNLGTEIRDSTLNSTNDVQAFFETFEEAAFVGVESLQVTQTVCVDGSSQIAIDDSCPTPAS